MLKSILYKIFKNKSAVEEISIPVSIEVVAYRISKGSIYELTKTDEKNQKLLPEELFISPSTNSIQGKSYSFNEPGNYYFSFPFIKNYHRMVLDDDVIENGLLISNIIVRGYDDNSKDFSELESLSQRQFLSLTCTKGCQFVQFMLNKLGVKSRLILTLTTLEENYYNDGHTLLEIFDEGVQNYVVVDVDKKCYFEDTFGRRLNAFSLCEKINKNEDYKIVSYSTIDKVDWLNFSDKKTNYNFQFIEQKFYFDKNQLLELYKRICAVIVIKEEGVNYSFNYNNVVKNSWSERLNKLSELEFKRRFYDEK